MILTTAFKSKGTEYTLSLDTEKADRNYDDENYAEWFVPTDDGRVLDVFVWQDGCGRFTTDGIVEVYKDMGDFEDGMLLDKKGIRIRLSI